MAPGFPKTAKAWPANRGDLFAGGAGGPGKLVQQASITPNARYDIAGWLGGTKTSTAELTVQFTGASGRILATAATGPAGKQAKPVLDYRQAAGAVPAGATRARVTITLTTTLTDWNGPDAPQTGYNHATAANYLALAGGSAFGVPLTDPEEENPLYNIDAANIGDLIAGSGESWKAYLQSATARATTPGTAITGTTTSR